MTKEQKIQLVDELVGTFEEYPNFYIANAGGLTVAETNELRGLCFESNVKMTMIKNTLIRKALERVEGKDFSELYDTLNEPSSVFFATAENPSVPAKVIDKFRKTKEVPILKVACIDTSIFIGDENLKMLTELKSKDELIGEIIGLLQSPAKNVVSALQSGKNNLAGLVKALGEHEN